jgi:hypothetical protein
MWMAIAAAMERDIGGFRLQMPNLLRRLAEQSLEEIGLVLTALVVYDDRPEYPGGGLFQLAVREGLLPEGEEHVLGPGLKGLTSAQRRFWEHQVAALFDFFESD